MLTWAHISMPKQLCQWVRGVYSAWRVGCPAKLMAMTGNQKSSLYKGGGRKWLRAPVLSTSVGKAQAREWEIHLISLRLRVEKKSVAFIEELHWFLVKGNLLLWKSNFFCSLGCSFFFFHYQVFIIKHSISYFQLK